MNALQALEVGTYYMEQGIFDFAVEWLHFALETVKQSPLTKTYPGIKRFFEDLFEQAVSEVTSFICTIYSTKYEFWIKVAF